MAGNKEVNSNLEIKGKINLKDVPNNTPTGYLVWNSGIKDIAQRTPAQVISDLGLITANNIAASYYTKTQVDTKLSEFIEYNAEKNIFRIGTSKRITQAYQYIKDSMVIGTNVAPKITGAPDSNNGDFSKGYVFAGLDIFPDFEGNTNYNPSHPAHDSHVIFGRNIGKGIVDADNFTAFGTSIFENNDVPLALTNTIIGNNITNNKDNRLPSNRVVLAKSNGFNLRNSLTGNTIIGNSHWYGDIHTSTIIGQNNRYFSYSFNSIVIGYDNMNYDIVKYGENLKTVLDNDIIIGNGLYKEHGKYPETHNLIIGSTTGYGNGGWNMNYKPLIVGNFKTPYLDINGKLTVNGELQLNQQNEDYTKPKLTDVPLSIVSAPAGWEGKVSYDPITKDLVLNNAPAGRYVLAQNVPDGQYLFDLAPTNLTGGHFNLRVLSYSYDGATTWQYRFVNVESTPANREFAFELVGTVSGVLSAKLETTTGAIPSLSSITSKDPSGISNLEIRLYDASKNSLAVGKESGQFALSNSGFTLFGQKSLSKAVVTNDTICIGANNAQLTLKTDRTFIAGNAIANGTTKELNDLTVIGSGALSSVEHIGFSTVIGANALSSYKKSNVTYGDPGAYNSITAIGREVGATVTGGHGFILIGNSVGYGHNTINDSIGIIPGVTGPCFGSNNPNVSNAIVISGKYINAFGNNTTTIGNPETREAHIFGKLIAKERLQLMSYTKAQRNSLPSPKAGEVIWQTDVDESGIRVFDGSNWVAVAQGNDSRIINGQTAYEWGNHASQGYLKSVDLNGQATQAWVTSNFIPTSHPVNAVTGQNITNWNTAFGWGDHAGKYLPLSGGTLTGQLTLSNSGLKFLDDPYGGSGDGASMYISSSGGEQLTLNISVSNDADDIINFITPSVTGLKHNGNTVWDAGNFNPANKADTSWVNTNFIPKSHPVFNITQANINQWNSGGSGGSNYTPGSNISISENSISVVSNPTFSGNVTAPGFFMSSSRKLKKNIKPFEESALDMINELKIVSFDYKKGPKNKVGIIAEDSPEIFLSEEKDAVDLYNTVYIQAKAIQELKKEIEELKKAMNYV